MLKRYYTDLVTEAEASARQAFRFFTRIEDWRDWSSVIAHARLLGRDWEQSRFLVFMPRLPGAPLPPVPLLVEILAYEPYRHITWGIRLPMASLQHRFSFVPVEDNRCRIHHEEWSEGALTLMLWPVGHWIRRFNDRFARELAAMF
jgi:hypothetical protein